MTETYLDLVDRLTGWKAELRNWQLKEQQQAEEIKSCLMLQSELHDKIDALETIIQQMRFSEKPRSWFVRAFR